MIEFAILNFIDTLVRRIKKKDRERRELSSLLNKAQNTFYVSSEGEHLNVVKNSRLDLDVDPGAAEPYELEDENLLTPEESPTNECQWETIETMVINGNDAAAAATFLPT